VTIGTVYLWRLFVTDFHIADLKQRISLLLLAEDTLVTSTEYRPFNLLACEDGLVPPIQSLM
jgi:hypothetical protein